MLCPSLGPVDTEPLLWSGKLHRETTGPTNQDEPQTPIPRSKTLTDGTRRRSRPVTGYPRNQGWSWIFSFDHIGTVCTDSKIPRFPDTVT